MIKVLSVGNSFGLDTMYHVPNICKNVGMESFQFANLYIGGCSINRHYHNLMQGLADYKYYKNRGEGWNITEGVSIDAALREEEWDIISIQHGTGDKSRYTSPESYVNLVPLISGIRKILGKEVKIAFNMAWAADPWCTRHEITSYGGDQMKMYEKMTEVTQSCVASLKEVDVVSPTGTAIQNARARIEKPLTRDGFHLSFDLGRYIASLTYVKALFHLDIDLVQWAPEGVTTEERELAKKCAHLALANPYSVTKE